MHQLLPLDPSAAAGSEVRDPLRTLADDHRRAPDSRPWVMANMVMSVDGAYSADGRSAGLSSPADREVFHDLRALADVILVAAGTARTERYRRPSASERAQSLRAERGQTPVPRLVVVTRSAHIPPDQPFLTGDGPDPLLVHPEDADLDGLPAGVESLACGTDGVDLAGLLTRLRTDGTRLVLCEGGPALLGQLHHDGLIDEMFLTLAAQLVGGADVGLLGAGAALARPLDLRRVWADDDGTLLLTYRSVPTDPG